jgi:hypothetical protein
MSTGPKPYQSHKRAEVSYGCSQLIVAQLQQTQRDLIPEDRKAKKDFFGRSEH